MHNDYWPGVGIWYSAKSVAYMQLLTKLTANTSSRFGVSLALGQLPCWLSSVVARTEAYDLPAAASKLQVTHQKHLFLFGRDLAGY